MRAKFFQLPAPGSDWTLTGCSFGSHLILAQGTHREMKDKWSLDEPLRNWLDKWSFSFSRQAIVVEKNAVKKIAKCFWGDQPEFYINVALFSGLSLTGVELWRHQAEHSVPTPPRRRVKCGWKWVDILSICGGSPQQSVWRELEYLSNIVEVTVFGLLKDKLIKK